MNANNESIDSNSSNDRLIQLFAKGMLYEEAVDYCQKKALEGKNGKNFKNKILIF